MYAHPWRNILRKHCVIVLPEQALLRNRLLQRQPSQQACHRQSKRYSDTGLRHPVPACAMLQATSSTVVSVQSVPPLPCLDICVAKQWGCTPFRCLAVIVLTPLKRCRGASWMVKGFSPATACRPICRGKGNAVCLIRPAACSMEHAPHSLPHCWIFEKPVTHTGAVVFALIVMSSSSAISKAAAAKGFWELCAHLLIGVPCKIPLVTHRWQRPGRHQAPVCISMQGLRCTFGVLV